MEHWDLVVIGGGITGAGIYHRAAQRGLRVLLLEAGDFASGTSSKSSKLVHGGLRYLKQAQFRMTWHCVRERQNLLRQIPGLVEPLPFLMPLYGGKTAAPTRFSLTIGLSIYDMMAGDHNHTYLDAAAIGRLAPHVKHKNLKGGFQFLDARTDDARLVLRLLTDPASQPECRAHNYCRMETLHRCPSGWVEGVTYRDLTTDRLITVNCSAAINATGAWCDRHHELEPGRRLRPLRGSHLVFPFWKLPLGQAISILHPADGRPVFAIPWEGVTLFGTTDLDHTDVDRPPRINLKEKEYLLEALDYLFADAPLRDEDILATFSGIRPVLSEGHRPPSQESRESATWVQKGLLSVTGGKLTTFRILADQTLQQLAQNLSKKPGTNWVTKIRSQSNPCLFQSSSKSSETHQRLVRLSGRYGTSFTRLPLEAQRGVLDSRVEGTPYSWWEIEHALEHEQVVHLEDLLLRRTRLGLLLPQGGEDILSSFREPCMRHLGWSPSRWSKELKTYQQTWLEQYSTPNCASNLTSSGASC